MGAQETRNLEVYIMSIKISGQYDNKRIESFGGRGFLFIKPEPYRQVLFHTRGCYNTLRRVSLEVYNTGELSCYFLCERYIQRLP